MTVVNFDPGEIAYEAYKLASDGVSLVSGAALPDWADVEPRIREAWSAVEDGVIIGLGAMRQELPLDEPEPAEPKRYALVEQMGHRSTIATIRETTFAGKQMIEATDLKGGGQSLISPESIYEITWITEADAIARTKPWTPVAITAGNPNPWGAYGADDYDDGTLPDPENAVTGRTPGGLDVDL